MQKARVAEFGEAKCSHCRHRMRVVWHSETELELDYCRSCSLLWFDRGESQTLERGAEKELQPITGQVAYQYANALLQMDREEQKSSSSMFEAQGRDTPFKVALGFLGLPVEEDDDVFFEEPWVTWLLIAACFLFFSMMIKYGAVVFEFFAFYARGPLPSQIGGALMSFFMHASVPHLIGNMYFLWIFGDNVEDEIGKVRYLILIGLGAVAGALLASKFDPRLAEVPLVGASGGIAGLVAFYLLRFPRRRFVMRILFIYRWALPSWLFGFFFFSKDLIGISQQLAGATNVSHLAHLGGAIVGVFTAVFLGKNTPR